MRYLNFSAFVRSAAYLDLLDIQTLIPEDIGFPSGVAERAVSRVWQQKSLTVDYASALNECVDLYELFGINR